MERYGEVSVRISFVVKAWQLTGEEKSQSHATSTNDHAGNGARVSNTIELSITDVSTYGIIITYNTVCQRLLHHDCHLRI